MSNFLKPYFAKGFSDFCKLRILNLVLVILIFERLGATQSVEFSQFHLPPCCYIPAPSHIGPDGGPQVAFAPSEQNGTIASELPHTRSVSPSSGEIFAPDANTNQVYKLIVPLKFPSSKAAAASLLFLRPPPQLPPQLLPLSLGEKLEKTSEELPEESPPDPVQVIVSPSQNRSTSPPRASSPEKDAAGSERYNVFLLRELEKLNRLPKVQDHPQPQLAAAATEQKEKEESVFERIARLGFSVSNRLQQLSTRFNSMAATTSPLKDSFQNSHGPYQMYKTFVKRQAVSDPPLKMPSLWVKNLRKALYQSLSTRRRETADSPSGSTSESDPGQYNGLQRNNKVLWRHLKSAKLKFIDQASEVISDLPEEIFLPAGQGPIVSGIATLAGTTGNLEIRIPSQLYNVPHERDSQGSGSGEGVSDFCKCNLIAEGDMVLAYWSISRVISDDGQPALQYLVFPHPQPYHTVNPPTPPQLIPFTNPYDFKPSPVDPLANEIPPGRGYHRHKPSFVIDARRRTPKYNHGDYYAVGPHNPLPPPPPHHQGFIPDQHGVPIHHNNGKYTDDFLSLYRAAIDHHFHNIDSMKSTLPVDNGYFQNLVPDRYPLQIHQPTPASPIQPVLPHAYQDIPYGYAQVPGPPTTIPGIATPVQPPPQHHLQPNLHDDHPKSIQDIISPFVPPPPPPHDSLQYPYNNNIHQQQRPFQGNIIHDGGVNFEGHRYNTNVPPNVRKNYNHQRNNYNRGGDYPNNSRPNNRPNHSNYPRYDKHQPSRDEQKKYNSYTKDKYYDVYKASGVKNNFSHKIGGGATSDKVGGSLNDIDNPNGYILDFK